LDRCALFVDAGYALGDGALAVHGTRHRDSVSWDHAGLLKLLSGLSSDRTGLPLLRCYWYDVAAAGSRAAEHDSLADVPGVRLRLSKARPSRKEGVEAEMRKDLTALARNHAVTDVIIVSAEEDLAPAIAEVQEFGVRTVLLHIGPDGSSAASRALRQECDDVIEVSAGHLRPFVELIVGAEPQRSGAGYRELAGAGSLSGPQPALDASGSRLFAAPAPAGYERAPQLAAMSGQGDHQPGLMTSSEPASFAMVQQGDDARAAALQHVPDGQHAQPQPASLAPQFAHAADPLAAGIPAAATGYGQAAFSTQEATFAANGHGFGQHGAPPSHLTGQAGLVGPGMTGTDPAQIGLPGPAMPGQVNGAPANGMPSNGLLATAPAAAVPGFGTGPANGVPGGGVTRPAVPQGSQVSGGSGQPGPGPAGPGSVVQPGFPVPGQGLAVQQGAHRQIGGSQGQNGLMSVDQGRPPLPGRQLPAGNGLPYGQDRSMPYAGQLQEPQFAGQPGQQPYAAPSGYGGQPPQLPALSLSVGDAVQSAHAEGFGFGEAVARDAPALWLEAVLARKPRMPSDLEARLLQGSALPIDSLLHDEVRHALRRGFWDALERSRH
jgi:hypothetical protein